MTALESAGNGRHTYTKTQPKFQNIQDAMKKSVYHNTNFY